MSLLDENGLDRRDDSKGWPIWVCWGLEVVVDIVEGVEASGGVQAYVDA